MTSTPGDFKKIQFFPYNYVEDINTKITANSEDAQFPVSNLKNSKSTKVFRTVEGVNDAQITFDFITQNPVNAVFIRANFRYGFGFSGDITIEANATDEWTSPAFTKTISPNHEHGIGWVLFDDVDYRFWRITGSGGNYFELADVFIGRGFEAIRNITRNFRFRERDRSTFTENEYGQRFTDIRNTVKEIRGRINLIPKENTKEFQDFFKFSGEKYSFFCILDECGCVVPEPERFAGRFFWVEKPDVQHVIKALYNTDRFTMREQP